MRLSGDFRKTVASALLWLLCGCVNNPKWTPARIQSAASTQPASIVLPMEQCYGLPLVPLGEPGTSSNAQQFAIIDTGAYAPMLTEAFAKQQRFHISQSPTLASADAFGEVKATPYVAHVPALSLWDAKLCDFDALVVNLPSMQMYGPNLGCILGGPVFRDAMVTFDYPHHRLVFEPGAALDPPNGKDIFPLRYTPTGKMEVPMKIRGQETWLTIDTGYGGQGLMLPRYQLIGIPWVSLPVPGLVGRGYLSSKPVRVGRMEGDIEWGQYTLRQPILAVSEKDYALMGYGLLRQFAMTIDVKNGRVRFRAQNEKTTIDFLPVRRLEFACDRAGVVHLSVDNPDHTPILSTDRVVEVDGCPVDKLTYRHWQYFEERGAPLNVRVMRDGQAVSLRVPVDTVVP